MAVLKCATLILLLHLCGALAATKCGKLGYKAKYGERETFKSPSVIGSTCRYRIRAPKGLHIKLIFDNSAGGGRLANFKVYDASKRPFKWRPSHLIGKITGRESGESERVFETQTVGIEFEGSSLAPQISFGYSAVVPSDNNFGYDEYASSSKKSIRTPGFPKAALSSGLRSTWNLRSKDGKPVFLLIQKLKTASDQDYLEVYDGDRVLERFSRRLNSMEPEPELVAYSGHMKVYFHTETSRSKGFKATYKTLEDTHSGPSKPDYSGGLQCHNRQRVLSDGKTVQDSHSTIVCPSGHVCGRMQMEGRENTPGSPKMTSEMLNCIPEAMCSDTECRTMPPPPNTNLLSCSISCCSTNMCNRSPDGPDVPPITDAEPSRYTPVITDSGLQCHTRSEVKVGELGTGAASGGYGCSSDQICALYVFQGTATDPSGKTVSGTGYAAKCELESNCNQQGCRNIDESRYINITSCEVNCCKTERCNAPPDDRPSTTPTSAGESDEVTECYEILSSTVGGISVLDNEKVTQCRIPDSRCSKIHMRANATISGAVEMVYGACVPSAMCGALNCNALSSSMPGINIETCDVSCCDTNLCNKKDTDTVVTPSAGTTECYEILSTTAGGRTIIDNRKVSKCDLPNSRCSRIDVVASSADGSTAAVAAYGTCVPAAVCGSMDCSVIESSMAGLEVKSCKASCCETNLCNEFPSAHVESVPELPLPTVEMTAIRCYDMLDIKATGVTLPLSRKKEEKVCSPGSQCMRIEAVAAHKTHSSIKVTTVVGACQPSFTCISLDCSSMRNPMPDVDIISCKASCCDTDLCNG